MTWSPPLSLEERFKRTFLPPRWVLQYHIREEFRRGEAELRLVPFLANPKRVSIDIGANKGVWTEVLRPYSSKVVAFEPNPKLFDVLSRGLGANVEAHPVALSDQEGEGALLVPRGRRGYSNQGASLNPARVAGREYRALNVATCRLDDMITDDVGFMKVDVEGHELAVLRGGASLIRRCKPNLIVEIEEVHTGRRMEDMLAEVCDMGYDCFALRNGCLTALKFIDLEVNHRNPAHRRDYIFNWIFLPK